MEAFQISTRALVDVLGISLDRLKSTFADIVNAFEEAAKKGVEVITGGLVHPPDSGIDDIVSKVSMQDLLDKFNVTTDQLLDPFKIDPLTLLLKFCKQAMAMLGG